MDPTKMKLWATKGYNVLLEGYHGTGKTASIKQLFNELYGEQGVDWLYFSSSTMDAWVDFVGVPREVVDADGTRYLDLIRPRALAKGTVKAIFFDEFNRAPAKTRNAVMELLQFKSINGKRFDNLSVIWAAINPDEDGVYDVERLDPAQRDRFDVYVKVPYDVNKEYFFYTYGRSGEAACDWWRNQDEDTKRSITPRRLETAIRMWRDDGDIADVLPETASSDELLVQLDDGSYMEQLKKHLLHKDIEGARESLLNENFYHGVEKEILDFNKHGMTLIEFFVPLMPPEKIVKLVNEDTRIRGWVVKQPWKDYSHIFDPILEIYASQEKREEDNVNASLLSRLKFWKKESGGDNVISDNDYIDMVSDFKMNIAFFKNEQTRTDMLTRLSNILTDNKGLTRVHLTKMVGPLLEMFRLKEQSKSVHSMIKKVAHDLTTIHGEQFASMLTTDLPGLRTLKNKNAFEKIVTDLKNEGLV